MLKFEKLNRLDSVLDQKTLLGYFPCLTEKVGQVVESPPIEYIQDFEEEQGNVQSVGWQEQFDGTYAPVLFIKNARDVCKHLITWMNGDTSWFTLIWESNKEDYWSLALIPDLKRMIKNSGLPNIKNTNVFQWVWSFNSAGSNPKVKEYLKAKGHQKVVFVDVKDHSYHKTFSFPVYKQSEISVMDPLINQCWTHLFKN